MSTRPIDAHDQRLARDFLSRIWHINSLSAGAQDLIARSCRLKQLGEGEVLWERGEQGDFFALICEGFIEINRYSTSESETTVGLFGPCDAIGMIAALRNSYYPGTARGLVARTRVLKCFLKPGIQSTLENEIQTWLRDIVFRHEQVLRDKIDVLNGQNAEIRLLELILQLTRRFGRKDSSGRCRVELYLTRAQISRFVNIRVETVIRILSRWNKAGWVTWNKGGLIVVNIRTLKSSLYGKLI